MLDNAQPTSPRQPAQPSQIGPYLILDRIGQGGMGVVYEAVHIHTSARVALKTIRHTAARHLASLRLEIHALTGLRHPGVVRFVDEGVHEGLPWYAMEVLEGLTLWDYLGSQWGGISRLGSEEISTRDSEGAPELVFVGSSTAPLPLAPVGPGRAARPSDKRLVANGHLVEVLTITRGLCDALAFIHGQGIVHRDLKPGNVFIRDGRPVLMDFGLASRSGGGLGREKLEISGLLVGTAAYIAPEQARGSSVDARADLYALGCMLYELLTGRTPFESPSVSEILRAHTSDPPYAPSQLVDGVPPALDQLVLRLLAKKPRDRIGHADDLGAMLVALGAHAAAEPAPQPRAYLYRPEIAGRRDALAELNAQLLRVESRSGGFVLIDGESGVGKTCIVAEVARRAATRHVTVVTGECMPIGSGGSGGGGGDGTFDDDGDVRGAPLHPFRSLLQAVADRCREKGAEETARLFGARGKILQPLEPSLAHLPGQAELPDPALLPPGDSRSRLLNALAETLSAFAWSEPVVLILDDLQWADELTLSFLSSLPVSWFESIGVLLIGTYRAEELTRPLEQLSLTPHIRRLSLQRLDDATVGALVGDMLALADPPRPLVSFLARHSSGNPFFVAEYLRSAVEEELLRRDAAGRWQLARGVPEDADEHSLPVPRSLADLVGRRLDRLSPAARRLVEIASVLGRELDGELLEAMHPRRGASMHASGDASGDASGKSSDESVLDAIKELTARQVIEELSSGHFRFVHDKLREVAYERLAPDRRRALHGQVAAAIEERYAARPGFALSYPALAHHFSLAEMTPKAIEYFEKTGEQALGNSANQEAIASLSSALSLDDTLPAAARSTPERRAAWERQLGTAELGLGRLVRSKEHFKRAAALLGWSMPETRSSLALHLVAQLARQILHLLFPRRFLGRGAQDHARLVEVARIYGYLSLLYYFAADMANVTLATLRSLNLAELARPSPELALAYGNAQLAAGLVPLHGLAARYRRRAFETLDTHGDGPSRCRVLSLTVGYSIGVGAWTLARTSAEAGLSLAKEIGFRRTWEEIKGCDNHRRIMVGDFTGMKEAYASLYEPTLRTETQGLVWSALQSGLDLLMAKGDAKGALAAAEEGLRRMSGEIDRGDFIAANATKAAAHLRLGQRDLARAAADLSADCVAKGPPVIFYAGFGFAFVADVYTQLWQGAASEDERRVLHKKARRACKVLFECARVLSIEEPQAWIQLGCLQIAEGKRAKGRRSFERSLLAALRLENPFDEAMARIALGEHQGIPDAVRRAHLERAAAFFAATDAPAPLARARKALALLPHGDAGAASPPRARAAAAD